MKYVIVLGDGMADEPIEALGGATPLAYADIPTNILTGFAGSVSWEWCTRFRRA